MEKWKNIPNYENYQVSTLGMVQNIKFGRILKIQTDSGGYSIVGLYNNGIGKTHRVHKLVAIAFLDHKPNGMKIVVDHINGEKTDNRVGNLRLITQRENCFTHYKGSSKFKGVSWFKKSKKWVAHIRINGKVKHLGLFNNELDASKAYQKALS